jgi:hypothetical protein
MSRLVGTHIFCRSCSRVGTQVTCTISLWSLQQVKGPVHRRKSKWVNTIR